jgi:protein phosphatase
LSFAHVGDSRLYELRGRVLVQITQDDSWVATILSSEPTLTKSDLAHHPMRHVLTNVVGARDHVEIQVGELTPTPGTLFLLCSDGLHGLVDEPTIAAILVKGGRLEDTARDLVQAAIGAGGHDNITVVLLRLCA